MKKLGIVSTHPIQYNAPLFQMLAADSELSVQVFFSKKAEEVRFDKDFGHEVIWDLPLTDGYSHQSFAASTSGGLKALLRGLHSFQPDALLVYGWNFPGHWKVMRTFHERIPVWFRGDSNLLDPIPWWKRLARRALLSLVYRSVDRGFYVGQANRRYFLWCGLKDHQLVYAPHAVDNDYFMRDNAMRLQSAEAVRGSLGIDAKSTVFLFVGKLEAKKQPLELAHAFSQLLTKTSTLDAHLVFVGSGALENTLLEDFGSHARIHFAGFQNQSMMPTWYRVGDILCLPSKGPGETWGLAVNEALASGCTALVTDKVGCAEDLVAPQKWCAVVDAQDHSNWPAAMLLMAERIQSPSFDRGDLMQHVTPFNFAAFASAIKKHIHE